MKWSDRFRKSKNIRRWRGRFSIGRRRKKPGCKICGEEVFKHKPNSYYGNIEHAYKR